MSISYLADSISYLAESMEVCMRVEMGKRKKKEYIFRNGDYNS